MKRSVPTAVLVFLLGVSFHQAQEPFEEPLQSEIVEQAERRLMQVDVSVRGPAETVASLRESDFTLAVGRHDISEFTLDRVCIDGGEGSLDLSDPDVAAAAPRLRTMLFFDQTHLTSEGRRRSIQLARELVPELLAAGRSEVMVVSAGQRLEVTADWSDDPDELRIALDRLERDSEQRSSWADLEDGRVQQVMSAIDRMTEVTEEATFEFKRVKRRLERDSLLAETYEFGQTPGVDQSRIQEQETDARIRLETELQVARNHARVVARNLAREEAGRTSAGLSVLRIALRHLEQQPPPKAVVYFADTTRANAGDFYLALVNAADRSGVLGFDAYGPSSRTVRAEITGVSGLDTYGPSIGPVRLSDGNYLREFQDAIDLATENGVRFYTVQGRGLFNENAVRSRVGSPSSLNASLRSGHDRFSQAESTLGGLASETGGESFLGAADASQIADRILDDLTCLFVFSFAALNLQEDRRTGVWVEVDRPDVELRYRPKVIALSERRRDEARLANAFWGGASAPREARVTAVPTGFRRGKYTVLVQFVIPGSRTGNDWDMGMTALVGKSRTIEASGRLMTDQPDVPLVFEAEMRFKPGDFKITAVAKNNVHERLVSTSCEGSLPDPTDGDPLVAAITIVQRVPGAFVRGESTRTTGALAKASDDWLNPALPTRILALICGNKRADPVQVERSLEGASVAVFAPVELEFDEELCGLMIDAIDGGALTSGKFSYAVRLTGAAGSRIEADREFMAVTPEEIALARKNDVE